MKAIVNVKNGNELVYQVEFNSIKDAIDYAKEAIRVGFNSPAFDTKERKDVYVNDCKNGKNHFYKFLTK